MRALGKENLSPESLLCEYDVEEPYEEYAPWRLRDFDNKLNEKWDLFRISLNVDFGHEDGRIPLSIPGSGAQSWSHLGHRTEAMWDEIRRTYFGENDVTSATHPSTREVGGPRFVVDEGGLSRSQVMQRKIDELLETRDRYNADIERLQRLHERADAEGGPSIALPGRDVTDDPEGLSSIALRRRADIDDEDGVVLAQAIAIASPDEDASCNSEVGSEYDSEGKDDEVPYRRCFKSSVVGSDFDPEGEDEELPCKGVFSQD
jgi:hypothetical protein